MKTPLAAAFAFILLRSALAADPEALLFGSERIGVPPLSLSESIVKLTTLSQPGPFDRFLPGYSTRANSTSLSPSLIPLTGRPNIMPLKKARAARSPQVSREHGMPILVPGTAVDYKLTIVPPDRSVDFKLVIKDPTHARKRASAN
jgi:hypothetical protein